MEAHGHNVDRFTLSIRLEGEAMQEPSDVAKALLDIMGDIHADKYYTGHTSSIMDANGNRVGSWKFHLEGID